MQKKYILKKKRIQLGDLEVSRDWGWAPEYVKIMFKILHFSKPDDYIIATGKNTKLRNVTKYIFDYYKLNYKKHIIKSKFFVRPYEVKKILANNNKIQKKIKIKPKIFVKELIKKMIREEF